MESMFVRMFEIVETRMRMWRKQQQQRRRKKRYICYSTCKQYPRFCLNIADLSRREEWPPEEQDVAQPEAPEP